MKFTALLFLAHHPLTRGRHLPAAVARFLWWQVRSRLSRRAIVVDWVVPARLVVRCGMTGATGNIYAGLHEFEEMAFIGHLLRRGELFIDVGANVGTYSVLAASVAGANVVAFEPVPSTFDALQANVDINALSKEVDLYNAALGAREGVLELTATLDTVNHVLAPGEAVDGLAVPVHRLDDVLAGRPAVAMKIDVEGFEHEVLAGAEDTLKSDSLVGLVIELNGSGRRYGFDDEQIDRRIIELGFERCNYEPFKRELFDAPSEVVGKGNVIYVRNRRTVLERLKSAPPLRILGREI